MLETILPIVLSTFLKYVLLSYSSRPKSHGLRTSRTEQLRKYAATCQKRLIHLVQYTESRIVLKTGQYEKNVPPAYDSIPPQCRPQLLWDRLENLLHNIFSSEKSTLEINVSLFGVLHWQPPASVPVLQIATKSYYKLRQLTYYKL